MKKTIVFLALLLMAISVQARPPNWDNSYLSLDGGVGTSLALVDGFSAGLYVEPKFGISPRFMVGSKNGIHYSWEDGENTDNIIIMETQLYFRWNFLRLGPSHNPANIFVQGGFGLLGAFRGNDVHMSRASILADVTAGITIPISASWHIEPTISGGFPFLGGLAVTIGRKFSLPRRAINQVIREIVYEYEYVEILREIPPVEIISRVLISQVEYILFAPDIAVFNRGLDHDAQSLNELVINHVAQSLRENSDFHIRIEGHANPVTHAPGEIEELAALSEARANEVARLLRERGVAEEQIVVIALGGTRTVAAEEDHDHWNMNRRVELIMVQLETN